MSARSSTQNRRDDSVKPLEFKIYPSRANSLKIALTEDNAVIDHSAITRLAINVGSRLFDSITTPAMFDLTQADHVEIKLGTANPALSVGRHTSRLVVYDAGAFTSGYVWPEDFIVIVAQEAG